LEAAADCAVELSERYADTDPARAAQWLAVADERETRAYRAWVAALEAEGIPTA